MGVDVVFKVRPSSDLDPYEFDDLRRAFYEAYPDPDAAGDDRFPNMEWDNYEPRPTIEVACLDWYYGAGYERGHWPAIREMGDWLAEHIQGELRYGGDSADEWEYLKPWPAVREALNQHWDVYETRPYFDRRRAINRSVGDVSHGGAE